MDRIIRRVVVVQNHDAHSRKGTFHSWVHAVKMSRCHYAIQIERCATNRGRGFAIHAQSQHMRTRRQFVRQHEVTGPLEQRTIFIPDHASLVGCVINRPPDSSRHRMAQAKQPDHRPLKWNRQRRPWSTALQQAHVCCPDKPSVSFPLRVSRHQIARYNPAIPPRPVIQRFWQHPGRACRQGQQRIAHRAGIMRVTGIGRMTTVAEIVRPLFAGAGHVTRNASPTLMVGTP